MTTAAARSADAAIVLGDVAVNSNANLDLGMPAEQLKSADEVILSRSEYALSWSPRLKGLTWAAWKLTAEDLGPAPRSRHFLADPDLNDYLAAQNDRAINPKDFTGTCFDRGHQVPSADRTLNPEVNQKTFFMSNILPQTPWLNRGPWKRMEFDVRKLVLEQNQTVYLFAGPIYANEDLKIGPEQNIAVPTHNFKIAVSMPAGSDPSVPSDQWQVIAAIFPNVNSDGSSPATNHVRTCADSQSGEIAGTVQMDRDWHRYITTLDEVETQSRLQFLGGLRKRIHRALRPIFRMERWFPSPQDEMLRAFGE